jgi:acyl-CoA synthetase (AMP-forming)/AMP-acid ligase II
MLMRTSSDDVARASLAGILRRRAAREPDRIAFTFLKSERERENLTYGALDRRASAIAAWLLARKASDQRIILAYPAGLDFIAAFFGCLYAGAQPVPQPGYLRPRHLQKLAAVAADCGAAIALTDTPTLARLNEGVATPSGLTWAASDRIAPAEGSEAPIGIETSALAYLQYTSGSTSKPRGVRITHANLLAHLQALAATYQVSGDDVLVSWLPHFHDMGLVGKPLLAVYAGAPCVMLSPLQFLQRPARWLQAITDFRGTISAAPNFAYELCAAKITAEERRGLDLSSWRIALNGAEPVRAETHRRFLSAFAECGLQEEALSPCYGLAEATLMVSTSRPSQLPRIASFDRASLVDRRAIPASGDDTSELVGCGPPQEGIRVAIVDPQTHTALAAGAIGEIWVKGASVADGYFGSPEATGATFGAHLAKGEGPFLRTGDLGFLHEGELFIAGRIKDLIVVNGRNLYPQDIEQSVQAGHPALLAGRGAAFAVDFGGRELLVVVQELHRHSGVDTAALITAIRAAILNEHEVHAGAILLVDPGSVPVTSSGKLARYGARDLFLKGGLAPIAAWYESAVESSWPGPS